MTDVPMTDVPEPFYTVTERDRRVSSLTLVAGLVLSGAHGVRLSKLGRNVAVEGRAVAFPVPVVDLGSDMAAHPVSYVPTRPQDATGFDAVPGIAFSLGAWLLSDMWLGVSLPLILHVVDPTGPAMTDYLHRYLTEARPLGRHGAEAWGEKVLEQQEAWTRWDKARRDAARAETAVS
jgi:hypothetical protein